MKSINVVCSNVLTFDYLLTFFSFSGGIVTFTPEAIRRDPFGIRKKMKAIHQHPFWSCFILPTALGMAIRLDAGDADAVELFRKSVPCPFNHPSLS